MRSMYFGVVVAFFIVSNSLAQTEQWTKDIKHDWKSRAGVSYINQAGEIYIIGSQIGHYSYEYLAKMFVDKYDAEGNLLWHNEGFSGFDANNIAADAEENIYFAGYFQAWGGNTPLVNGQIVLPGIYVIKMRSNGQVAWISDNLGTGFPAALFVSSDGLCDLRSEKESSGGQRHLLDKNGHLLSVGFNALVLRGQYDRFGNAYQQYDADIVKYDPSEKILWKHPIQNGGTNFVVDREGNVYVREGGFSPETVLYKLDPNGQMIWKNALSNSADNEEFSLPYVSGENLYTINRFSENLQYQGFLIKRVDIHTGTILWSWKYTDSRMTPDVIVARDAAVYVSYSHMEAIKCNLTKLTDSAWIQEIPTAIPKNILPENILIRPNPTSDKVMVTSPINPVSTVTVSDARGKQLGSVKIENNLDGSVEVDLSAYPRGMYFLDIVLENNSRQTSKVIRQ